MLHRRVGLRDSSALSKAGRVAMVIEELHPEASLRGAHRILKEPERDRDQMSV